MNMLLHIIFVIISILYFELQLIPNTLIRIAVYLIISAVIFLFIFRKKNSTKDSTTSSPTLNKNTGDFEIQVISSQISSVSEQLAITLEKNISFSKDLTTKAKEMDTLSSASMADIKSAAESVNHISGNMMNIVDTSKKMRNVSNESKEILASSFSEIMDIVKSVKEIDSSTNIVFNYIEDLKNVLSEIDSVLNTVKSISSQTQLLSLNASIEAARAGEFGKGFSVVAEEIRKLSETSSSSVVKIGDLINSITIQMSKLIEAIEPNKESVKRSVECSGTIEQALVKIDTSSKAVSDMVDSIISATSEQNVDTQNVNGNIDALLTSFDKLKYSVEDVYASIKTHNKNIRSLEKMGGSLVNASSMLSELNEKFKSTYTAEKVEQFTEKTKDLINHIKDNVLSSNTFLNLDVDEHEKVLDNFMKTHSFVEAIWTNDISGEFIYSNPPAGIVNGKVRDWFKQSIQGEEFVSDIYISAITKNPCITISLPIKDLQGQIIGVIGADLHVNIE